MQVNKYTVNSKSYDSIEEMPPEVRKKFEESFKDENQDGIPDKFEKLVSMGKGNSVEASTHKISLDNPARNHDKKENLSMEHFNAGFNPNKMLEKALLVGLGGLVGYIMCKLGL